MDNGTSKGSPPMNYLPKGLHTISTTLSPSRIYAVLRIVEMQSYLGSLLLVVNCLDFIKHLHFFFILRHSKIFLKQQHIITRQNLEENENTYVASIHSDSL